MADLDTGDVLYLTARFRDQDEAPFDPDAVEFVLEDPSGTAITYVYDVDAELVRDGVGVYHCEVLVEPPGIWNWRWEASGQAAEEGTVTVRRSRIADGPQALLTPSVAAVALLMRTRTGAGLSTGLGADTSRGELTTFTVETRPTEDEVERMAEMAYDNVTGELLAPPDEIPDQQVGRVRFAITLYAAILIELSFFRKEADDAAVQAWRDLYTAAMTAVNQAVDTAPDTGSTAFGTLRIGTTVTAPEGYCGTPAGSLPRRSAGRFPKDI